ncbi:MAG: hypothetical protein ACE5RN_07180 [Nitrosopumilaceae archaeon]
MLSPRTIIGIIVGSAIIGIGIYALISSIGLHQVDFNDTFLPGESTKYSFFAPKSAKQWINITGDSFEVSLRTPRGGIQINNETYKKELSIEWVHLIDGDSILNLKNTGDSSINAKGYFSIFTEPIQITYHILVITAGVIIIGFSAGFSVRKPRGF